MFDQLTGKETSNEALFSLSVTMQATGSELGTISYASLGICPGVEAGKGSDSALPVIPDEPEE